MRGDTLLLLYGLDLLEKRGPGQKVVFDVKCTQALPEVLEAAGGVPVLVGPDGQPLFEEDQVGQPIPDDFQVPAGVEGDVVVTEAEEPVVALDDLGDGVRRRAEPGVGADRLDEGVGQDRHDALADVGVGAVGELRERLGGRL